ncbi:MAG: hypothetical protein OEU78_11990 [Gammaproteobacteria bacterium]|nr:hypothetical protein [Gammaproteobacteria bacterium]
MIRKIVAISILGVCLAGNVSSAEEDDVVNSINEGMEFYQSGEFAEATSSLNYAVQLIQQKKGESLSGLLPEPLDGWEAEEAQSQAAGAAMFGGGVTAERSYAKDNSRISIQIVTDSPMLQGVMMMFSNPMFATADGGKMVRVGRQKAIVKFTPEDESGDLQMVVNNRFLVTVEGSGVSNDDLVNYAKAIDTKKMADLP